MPVHPTLADELGTLLLAASDESLRREYPVIEVEGRFYKQQDSLEFAEAKAPPGASLERCSLARQYAERVGTFEEGYSAFEDDDEQIQAFGMYAYDDVLREEEVVFALGIGLHVQMTLARFAARYGLLPDTGSSPIAEGHPRAKVVSECGRSSRSGCSLLAA